MNTSTFPMALVAMTCSLGMPVCAQPARWGTPDNATVKMIHASEKIWLDGNCSPQQALKDVIAADFQGTAPSGERYAKKDAISSPSPSLDLDCHLGVIKVHLFGDATAVAYGTENSMRMNKVGKRHKRCLAWTDTWLKRSGQWQIVAAQDNEVACH
jgi:hypothetical protein